MVVDRTTHPHRGARVEPYPTKEGKRPGNPTTEADKENQSPPTNSKRPVQNKTLSSKEPDRSNLPSSYLDITLEEIGGEVPVYEDVRDASSPIRSN
jgi:hypothetical protein